MTPKILFVSHDANRAGAPILLLHIIEWVKKNTDAEFRILLLADGPLEEDFRRMGEVTLLTRRQNSKRRRLLFRITSKIFPARLGRQSRRVANLIRMFQPDVIYANTAVSLNTLFRLGVQGPSVLLHLHEMQYMIDTLCGAASFAKALPLAKRIICVAEAVKANLRKSFTVSPDIITVIPEPFERPSESETSQVVTKSSLGIPPDAFIVLGAGTGDWRKATDIFLLTAGLVSREKPIHFIWIGNIPQRKLEIFLFDAVRMGIDGRIHFPGVTAAPADYYRFCDVFYLTSREDPYPLVCLEAASFEKPVICFEGGGGIPEFVRDDAGFIVPYLDVAKAAERILTLYKEPGLGKRMGKIAATRALTESEINVVGPKIWRTLTETSIN